MKKFVLLSAFIFTLVGCTTGTTVDDSTITYKEAVIYNCPVDVDFMVEYSEDGKYAKVTDNSDAVYILKSKKSTTGTLHKNDDGISILKRGTNLTVTIVNGRPINCREYKR